MPIIGPASYIPTIEEFLNHWQSVNAALPAGSPLVIPGTPLGFDAPVTRAVLQGLYDALVAQHATVQTAVTDADLAREDLGDQKRLLLERLNQFNEKVRGLLPGTKWERRLPAVPSVEASRSRFSEPLETALNLWTRINGDEALGAGVELELLGEYNLAAFTDELEQLRTYYRTLRQKEDTLALERDERQDMEEKVYPVLKQYRVLMPTFFPKNHALVDALPILTPTSSRTPEPVVASGVWDAASLKALLTWLASDDPELDHYAVRWSPGTEYHTEDESTLGTVEPGAPLEFRTSQGLAEPEDVGLFRVYVVLRSGNEAGSNTVSVTRPE